MTSREYWKKREEEALKHYITDEVEYKKHIDGIYDYLLDQVQKEINGFYTKYADAEGITMAEAKKRVSKLDIEAYERKAEKYVKNKDFSKLANDEMRLYNLTMKVNRLEMLKANIGLEMVDSFDELQKYFEQILTQRTLDEFERQAGILGESIGENAKAAHSIVNASFNNATFSNRIWMYQDMLKSELSSLLAEGLIQGRHPNVLAKHLQKRFGVQKSYAERLMRTELCRVQIEAQKKSYENGGYEQYMFIATHDSKTCPTCSALDGQLFNVKDMQVGVNAPPLHPNDRCSTVAYMDRIILNKAFDVYNEAEKQEPVITSDLKDIEKTTNAKLRGLEYRLKNPDRIYQKLVFEPDKNVRDALRYTFELSEKNYVLEYREIIDLLSKKGYTLSAVKNYWMNKNNPYNGLNTNVFTNGKYEFEIQYHTKQSLKVKEEMHIIYEKQRLIADENSEEYIKLTDDMFSLADSVDAPPGIEGIKNYE